MRFRIPNETCTTSLMQMAAKEIGKPADSPQIKQLTEFLIKQHWLCSAEDFRAAVANQSHWHALELPVRLKLALHDLLEEEIAVAATEADEVDDVLFTEQTSTEGFSQAEYQQAPAESTATLSYHGDLEAAEVPVATVAEPLSVASPNYRYDGWVCKSCTMTNSKSETHCEACQVVRVLTPVAGGTTTLWEEHYSDSYTDSDTSYGKSYGYGTEATSPDPPAAEATTSYLHAFLDESDTEEEAITSIWECSVCTLHNDPSSTHCEACTTIRSDTNRENPDAVLEVDASESEVAQIAPVYAQMSLDPTEATWHCNQCGFSRNRMQECYCEVCCEHISIAQAEAIPVATGTIDHLPTAPSFADVGGDLNALNEVRPGATTMENSTPPAPYCYPTQEESKLKYPSLRDNMFNHPVDTTVQVNVSSIPSPPPIAGTGETSFDGKVILEKRKIRLPWQSKYKIRKNNSKPSKAAKVFGKLAFNRRVDQEDDSSSSSDGSDDSEEEESDEEESSDDDDEAER